MPKSYKKKYYRGSRDKYSVEQSAFTENITASNQQATLIIPPTAVQGKRKVKHLTISVATTAAAQTSDYFYWCLVYVPEGYNPNLLTVSSTSGASTPMYEPNQHVMCCGVFDLSSGPNRIYCPLSRNLNTGDRIILISANPTPSTITLHGVVRYAITFN